MVEIKLYLVQTGIDLSDIFLYIGTILVAFEIVKDISFLQSLFALPLAYPVHIAMKRIGVFIKRGNVGRTTLKYERKKVRKEKFSDWLKYIVWIVLFFLFAIVLILFSVVLIPMMMVLGLGRFLDTVNKLLNFIYQLSFQPWEVIYFVATNITLKYTNKAIRMKPLRWMFKNVTIQDEAKDQELRRAVEIKGILPFVAFIGLIFISAGFVLQLLNY